MRYVSQKYLCRVADKELETALRTTGAVLIEGSKRCGERRTATEFGYRRSDGVYVVPIGCLKD